MEYRCRLHLATGNLCGVGFPWRAYRIKYAPLGDSPSDPIVSAIAVKPGIQFKISPSFRLRAGLQHTIVMSRVRTNSQSFQLEEPPTIYNYDSLAFLNVGLRYEHASGFVAGLDVPLLIMDWTYDTPRREAELYRFFPPPSSIDLMQLYVGYAWLF